ncbi:restriction endonuclease subunit S [Hymenobacter swuensis]|uniref:Type I restriction modification DNA specificity domain-containing protein n=1 Tax=Hymenobacter swuensis DY53 TaxID=1227739 RepID=W8EQ76_9BACT|nr:restriction endonuclease subunit S [Hymenobacter swuensis]AHJ95324.1 hypothetical protein Hsw_PB0034 [Hymenobacter swuensis DY53]
MALYPTHWHKLPLADLLIEDKAGDWGKDARKLANSEVWTLCRVFRATDIADWQLYKGKYATTRAIEKRVLVNKSLRSGDILLEIAGGSQEQQVGRVSLVDEQALNASDQPLHYSNFFRAIRVPQTVLHPKFLYYFFKHAYQNNLLEPFQKATVSLRNLSFVELKSALEVPIPPMAEQELIIAKIERVEKELNLAKNKLQKVAAHLIRFRQSVLQDAVTSELQEGSDANLTSTGDIFEYVTSGARDWSRYYAPEGAFFLRIGNLARTSLQLELENIIKVQLPDEVDRARTAVQTGDLLISISGELILIAVVPDNLGEAYINQHLALARPKKEYYPKYLAYALQSSYCQSQLTDKQSGDAIIGLSLSDIKSINIPIPSYHKQVAAADRIDALLAYARDAQAQHEKAKGNIKQSEEALLNAAFETDFVSRQQHQSTTSDIVAEVARETILTKEIRESNKLLLKNLPKLISSMKGIEQEDIKEQIKKFALEMYESKSHLNRSDIDELRSKISGNVRNFDYDDFSSLFQELVQEPLNSGEEKPFFLSVIKDGSIHFALNK